MFYGAGILGDAVLSLDSRTRELQIHSFTGLKASSFKLSSGRFL